MLCRLILQNKILQQGAKRIWEKNSIIYVCDYQSDSFLEKKTTFECYNTSNKAVHVLFMFLLKVFILGLFVGIVYNLERQLYDTMAHFSVTWIYLAVSFG